MLVKIKKLAVEAAQIRIVRESNIRSVRLKIRSDLTGRSSFVSLSYVVLRVNDAVMIELKSCISIIAIAIMQTMLFLILSLFVRTAIMKNTI